MEDKAEMKESNVPDVEAGAKTEDPKIPAQDKPSSEPSDLVRPDSSIAAASAASDEALLDQDEAFKQKAYTARVRVSAVSVVSPKGKVARKEAQVMQTAMSQSPTPEYVAASRGSNSPTRSRQAWSEKEEARQLKSAVSRPSKEEGEEEQVVPGSFAVVPVVAGAVPPPTTNSDVRVNIDEGDNNDREEYETNEPTPSTSALSYMRRHLSSRKHLVEATLVDPVFAEASIMEADSGGANEEAAVRKRRFRVFVGVNVVLGIIGLVLLLYFLLRKEDKNPTPTASPVTAFPSTAPTFSPTATNPYNLPEATWQRILTDPTSPQGQAYDWLLGDIDQLDSGKTYEPWRIHQRYALALLYYATNGTDWNIATDWLSPEHECAWHTTADAYPCQDDLDDATIEFRQYSALHLKDNELKGTIPPEMFQLLPALQRIDLSENQGLTGALPTEVGILRRLEHVILSNTHLEGSIPFELYALTQLQSLDLSFSKFGGALQSQIGALSELQLFNIGNNAGFAGDLPTELGLLTLLTKLSFERSQFGGSLLTEFGRLTQLKLFHLHKNRFSGPIPTEVGNMKALEDLRLYSNRLTGPMPSEIGELSQLQFIVLEINNLTSTIPTEFGRLRKLKRLLLKDNQLNGTIPSELGNMSAVKTISVQRNRLSGAISQELGRPTSLEGLLLHENSLTGSIPNGLFSHPLPLFQRLLLYSNKLNGTIPSELGLMTMMTDCWIHSNALSGTLPATVGLLTSLISLSINDTILSGPIPPELERLSQLQFFNLSDTDLTGTIPDELCRLNGGNRSGLLFDCSDSLCGCGCDCIAQPVASPPEPTTIAIAGSNSSAESIWTVQWSVSNTSDVTGNVTEPEKN